jgi:membrane protein DedA with SNARE-associated domain
MPHDLLLRVLPLLARFGYPVLLPIAVVEGPAITIIAGALVAAGQFNPVIACLLLVVADLVGDLLYYCLGRFGHAPLVEKLSISKRLSVAAHKLPLLEQRFRENDWKLLMLGKTQALGSVILYMAGASKTPFGRYMVLNLIGTFPKVILFETIGYLLGRGILSSTRYIDMITFAAFGVAGVLLVSYLLLKRLAWKDLLQVTS